MVFANLVNVLVGVLGLAVLGVGMLVWRGRRVEGPHCRRCWYDLSGVEQDQHPPCPECGYQARHTLDLHPRRRRWKALGVFAASAVAIIVLPWPTDLGQRTYPLLPDHALAIIYANSNDQEVRRRLAIKLVNHAQAGSPFPDHTLRVMTEGAIKKATGSGRHRLAEMDVHVLMSARWQFDNATDSARLAALGQSLYGHPDRSVRETGGRLSADAHDPASTAPFAIEMSQSPALERRQAAREAIIEHLARIGPSYDDTENALYQAYVAMLNDPDYGIQQLTESGINHLVALDDDRPDLAAALLDLAPRTRYARACRAEQLALLLRNTRLEAFARDIVLHGDEGEREAFLHELEDLYRDDAIRAAEAMPVVFERLERRGLDQFDISDWLHDAEDFCTNRWAHELGP
ncbi:MAG: hypothetical protein ACFCBV_12055 [Phycisphaerales bacterium]